MSARAATIALDASISGRVSAAALFGDRSAAVDVPERPAEALPGVLAGVLEQVGATVDAVARCIVGVGPGSFTGVRCVVSFANALAYAGGCELSTIGSLEAVAFREAAEGETVAVAMDAGRGRSHVGAYRREAERVAAVGAEATVEDAELEAVASAAGAARLTVSDGVALARLYLDEWRRAPELFAAVAPGQAQARYLSPALLIQTPHQGATS